jgi:hypothetical protein
MPVVGLADGLVEGPVLDMKQAASVEGARCDHGGVPVSHKLREEVMGLLAVGDVGKGPVLALEKDAGVHQDPDEKPRLTLGKPKVATALTRSGRALSLRSRRLKEFTEIPPPHADRTTVHHRGHLAAETGSRTIGGVSAAVVLGEDLDIS